MAMDFSQRQKTSQTMARRMGQKQIQSLNLLSMNAADLREAIFKEVEKNPALEIVSDKFQNGLESARYKKSLDGGARVGHASSSGQEKSDAFQEILESRADERKSLYAHLSEQLSALDLPAAEKALCQKIIENLDARGFYILAPISLLDRKAGEDAAFLEKCLGVVQRLDPPGVCAENVEKSLLLQARLKGGAPRLALFLLDGRLSFLNPPQAQKVLEKIQAFLREQKKLSFAADSYDFLKKISEADIAEAVAFIQGLDPYPARGFDQTQARYVEPDIYVERAAADNSRRGSDSNSDFTVTVSDKALPKLGIAADFGSAKKASPFAAAAIKSARAFLEALEARERSVELAARAVVQCQSAFFEQGPGHLVPLRQKDIAERIGVHESTVSRMASSKFIQCQWGLFPLKFFFSSAVAGRSKESVQQEIRNILKAEGGKKLSDQKICAALAERGIKVSRRAVAKYRLQMQMENSYKR